MQISTIFDATKYSLEYDKLAVMDKWILSKLNSAVAGVDECPVKLQDSGGGKVPSGVRRRLE